MNFVADTHALLWWFTDSPKISSKASEIFQECERGENVIFIPSIVIAESLSIFDKKRISFNFDGFVKSPIYRFNVIPAKAGIQFFEKLMDSRLRGSDAIFNFLRVHQL